MAKDAALALAEFEHIVWTYLDWAPSCRSIASARVGPLDALAACQRVSSAASSRAATSAPLLPVGPRGLAFLENTAVRGR